MKFVLRTIVVFILSLFVKESTCQEKQIVSPCPDVFKYQTVEEKIYGIITIPTPKEGQWTVLNVSIGNNAQSHSGEKYLELLKSRDETVKDALMGKNIQYRLFLSSAEMDDIPIVKYILLNGNYICRGPYIFHNNNWSFKHSFLFGRNTLRTEHTSNTEEIYSTFYDWLYAQPRYASFLPEPIKQPEMKSMPLIEATPRMAHDGRWLKDIPLKCGMKPPMESKLVLATLILNGTFVAKGEYPWLVYLEYTNSDIICGGTLVSDRHIITAAHCVKNQKIIGVQLGKHIRSASEEGSIRRDPRVIIIHPEYKKDQAHADIAIIVVDSVPLTHQIYPICIWPFGIQLDEVFPYGTVAGWGIFRNDETSSNIPMKTNVPIVSLEICRQSVDYFKVLATDHTICAGGRLSGPCYGDSGSGMYFRHMATWYLRGVVSTSLRDSFSNYCQTNHYAVYVDIAFYLDWLRPYIMDIENDLVKITSRIDSRFGSNRATIIIDS